MKRQISAAEAAAAHIHAEDTGKVTALVKRPDGGFERVGIGGFTLERMHSNREIEYYIEEPTPEEAWERLRETVRGERMARLERETGQRYIVTKDGEAFARFTWKTDAAAYLEGARASDPASAWELCDPDGDLGLE